MAAVPPTGAVATDAYPAFLPGQAGVPADATGLSAPLPPPPPAPGVVPSSTTTTVKTKTKTSSAVPPAMRVGAPEAPNDLPVQKNEYDALVERLNAKGIESLAQQQEGIKALEEYVKRAKSGEGQMDLSPLLSLYDSWFGANTQAGYKRPLSPEERDRQAFELEAAVQRARGGLSDTEIDLLRSQLGLEETRLARTERAGERAAAQAREEKEFELRRKDMLARNKENDDRMALERGLRLDKQGQEERYKFTQTKEHARVKGATELNNAIRDYEQALNTYGMDPRGEGAEVLKTAYTNMTLAYKSAADLGALAAADMELVRANAAKAGGAEAYIRNKFTGSDIDTIKKQLDQARKSTGSVYQQNMNILDKVFPGQSTADLRDELKTQFSSSAGSVPVPTDRAALLKELGAP